MIASNMPRLSGRKATEYRRFGRIPSAFRAESLRRMSGRAWHQLGTDNAVGTALGIEPRNAGKRRSGQSGPFAGLCEEVYRLESAGISTHALTAHLRSLAMQTRLRDTPTEELQDRLVALHEREQAINGALDLKQLRHASGQDVCLLTLRDRAGEQAAISEEMVAIAEELIARRQG